MKKAKVELTECELDAIEEVILRAYVSAAYTEYLAPIKIEKLSLRRLLKKIRAAKR